MKIKSFEGHKAQSLIILKEIKDRIVLRGLIVKVPCVSWRAEDDEVVRRCTMHDAVIAIRSITVSEWAGVLEILRVRCQLAVRRPLTAMHLSAESVARALTPHSLATNPIIRTLHLQLSGT